MIFGEPTIDCNMPKLDFGQHCEAHDGTDNAQNARSVGTISLMTKNNHGSYQFLKLENVCPNHSMFYIGL